MACQHSDSLCIGLHYISQMSRLNALYLNVLFISLLYIYLKQPNTLILYMLLTQVAKHLNVSFMLKKLKIDNKQAILFFSFLLNLFTINPSGHKELFFHLQRRVLLFMSPCSPKCLVRCYFPCFTRGKKAVFKLCNRDFRQI